MTTNIRYFTASEIESLTSMKDAMEAVEKAFAAQGETHADNLTQVFSVGEKKVSIKAGYVAPMGFAGIKCIGFVTLSHLEEPTVPIALFEQAPITWLRTGAAGGVAAKFLARPESRTVGILGSGKQARAQLVALHQTFTLTEVKIWSPGEANRKAYAEEMARKLGIRVVPVASPREAVTQRDIVVTATRSCSPLVEDGWLAPGTHVNAIGSDLPGMQELSSGVFVQAAVFADDVRQAVRIGAVNVPVRSGQFPASSLKAFGEVVAGKLPGRTNPTQITIFDCSGIGMMDVALVGQIYRRTQ